jgi:hypothetical protein
LDVTANVRAPTEGVLGRGAPGKGARADRVRIVLAEIAC